ncbi:hypothetical protein KFU94_47415 [Chloroflexi bacterium TSY]|nr:hypothetical protein [Chloroflexi bacterium TSY]
MSIYQKCKPNFEPPPILHLLRCVVLLSVAMVTLAGASGTSANREQQRIFADIHALLLQENSEFFTGDQEGANQNIAQTVDLQLLNVERFDGLTAATLLTNQPSQSWRLVYPYRETRYYQETDAGWQQVAPGKSFWGEQRMLETPHLRFEYLDRDHAAIERLAVPVENVYVTLHRRLRLALPAPTSKLTIEITPNLVNRRSMAGTRIEVSSPFAGQIPVGLSDDDYLMHEIVRRLVYWRVSGNNTERLDGVFSARWRIMRRGLRSWLETDLLGQESEWDQQAKKIMIQQLHEHFPMTVTEISGWEEPMIHDREYFMLRTSAAKSLIEYIVVRHGQDKLGDLLRGFTQHRSWSDLIPALLDESVEEFEAGWNRYLGEHYFVQPSS